MLARGSEFESEESGVGKKRYSWAPRDKEELI
jgi:hypothetical protein